MPIKMQWKWVMDVIVVTADSSDKRLRGLLQEGCGEGLSFLCVEAPRAVFSAGGCDLVLLSHENLDSVSCEFGAFIVRGNDCLPHEICCEQAVAIVDSSNAAVMEQAAQRHLRAVTCGLGTSDTLTLSSITNDSAVISLQRPITAFDGTLVEPFELPVHTNGRTEPFSLLAVTAVFCLMGKQSPLLRTDVWNMLSM